ncbi:glycosyl transferase family 1 [Marinilabilia rubra]|uniref:Glycosyl transferase family 1 n=2 Tax=Marinilabilia rubra TaxID=2162893 RepID=A0A2U2BBV8_9BACT|nr:glycosyl transferase family 1 [Marinilabilia rubra]
MENYPNVFSGRVLFVCSGNKNGLCTPAVNEQARALKKRGVKISFFRVERKGVAGYLRGALTLKRHLKENKYDVIHAHYGLSAIMATLSGARPLVVSLMGSDVFGPRWILTLVKFFTRFFWPVTIVKSWSMAQKIDVPKVLVIPNGVDMELFREIPRKEARQKCGFSKPKVVMWPADPGRKVKNFDLAAAVMKVLNRSDVELKPVYGIDTMLMPYFYNASDVVLLTSLWEGSPNVVKEALACNVPVVSTRVGDVEERINGLKNCSTCDPYPEILAKALQQSLENENKPDGRNRIKELDNNIVVRKLLTLYSQCI